MGAQDEPAIETHLFEDDGRIPNNPTLPLLLYRRANQPGGDLASAFEETFARHDWRGSWRNGIFPFPHYHSIAHEVLGIADGRVRCRLGGARGIEADLQAGDVVVIPAGVGHQNLGDDGGLLVIGAYPGGGDYDLCRGDLSERPAVLENIAKVAMPACDPLMGPSGPLRRLWMG